MDWITENMKCSELRRKLDAWPKPGWERTVIAARLAKSRDWRNAPDKDPEVQRALFYLFYLSPDEVSRALNMAAETGRNEKAALNDQLKSVAEDFSLDKYLIDLVELEQQLGRPRDRAFFLYLDLRSDRRPGADSYYWRWSKGSYRLFGELPDGNQTSFYATAYISSLKELKEDDSIKVRLKRFHDKLINILRENRLTDRKDSLEANLQTCCDDLLEIYNEALDPVEAEVGGMIEGGVTQLVLTGAPGTGKTRMAKQIAEVLGAKLGGETDAPRYKLVQFHPSYDYTDFVEGLRPYEKAGDTDIHFGKMDGAFKAFCRGVAELNKDEQEGEKSRNSKYFFIIDEINRADLSKVFGELMYCLESDKRGEMIQTQYQKLPTYTYRNDGDSGTVELLDADVFKDGFFIPENAVVIGTMNDIDRSVESMDFALRRRFAWKEIKVEKEPLERAFASMLKKKGIPDSEGTLTKALAGRIMALNHYLDGTESESADRDDNIKAIEQLLSRHYYISQGQFAGLSEKTWRTLTATDDAGENLKAFLTQVWNIRVKMLIEEYVRGETAAEEFVTTCGKKLGIREENENRHS